MLSSKKTPVVVRRAAAEALGHVLGRVLEVLTNFLDESRPAPRLQTVQQILPVAVLGLADADVGVRGSSLIACERAARILDELTRNQQMPPERLLVFQPTLQVVTEALPKINDAALDSVPALRVSACRVLETLALAALRLRKRGETRPPSPLPEPSKPSAPLPKEEGRDNKEVSLPTIRRGRRTARGRPSQWAAARVGQPVALPLPPPVPLIGETSTPAVTLERPIKLSSEAVSRSPHRVASPGKVSALAPPHLELRMAVVRPAAFVAPRMDELPVPTPIPGFWNRTVQTMIKNLSDPDYRVRLGAVDVLETLGDRAEAAIPALVKALRDSNKFVRWGAARTLGRLAPRQAEEVVPGLVALLNDREDIGVREKGVLPALQEYGVHAKQAVPHLARVINRGDKEYILGVLH
ncbi:MAG: HEAT repeat domain-containing protein, partial [Gemmataceae bacterium]